MRKCDRIFKKFDERAELFGSLLDNLAKDVATPKKTSRPILAQRDQSSESIAVSKNNGRNRTECALCLYEFPMDSLVSYASYSSIQKFRNRVRLRAFVTSQQRKRICRFCHQLLHPEFPLQCTTSADINKLEDVGWLKLHGLASPSRQPAASMQSQTPPPASLAERSREEDDISSSDEEWTEEESSEDDEYPSEEEVQRVSSLLAQLADENASLQKQLLDLKKEQVEVLAAKKYYIELRRRRRKTNHELTLRRQEEFWTGGVSTGKHGRKRPGWVSPAVASRLQRRAQQLGL